MTFRRHLFRTAGIVFLVLTLIAVGIALPVVVGERGSDLTMKPATLMAGPRDSYVIAEPLALVGFPNIQIERGTVSLSQAQAASRSGTDAAALISSGGADLVLEDATLVIDAAKGITSLALTSPQTPPHGPLATALATARFHKLSLSSTIVIFRLPGGRQEVLSGVDANLSLRAGKELLLVGTGLARGQKIAFDGRLGLPPQRVADFSGQLPFSARIKGALVSASFEGKLALANPILMQGNGELSIVDGRRMARWLGFGWPDGPGLKDFRAKGPVEWNGQRLAFQRAQLSMDGNKASGTLSITSASGRIGVDGTVALQTLDITDYVKDWGKGTGGGLLPGYDAFGGAVSAPFALPLVKQIDADLRISAERVRASSVTFGRAAATLSVRSAKLLADIAELELFEAMGSGQLVVDATDGKPRFSLKAKLPRGDLGKVVEAFSGLRGIQGQGDVSIDFAASGETLQDILHTISGKAGLAMNEGGRLGIDLKSLTKAAQNRPITGWSHALRATTPIENLIARLTLSDGAVYADAVNAMTPDGIVTATGGGNLRTGLVDLKVKIGTPNATERELKALALEAAPDQISVKGPWSAPTIRSETPKSPPPTTPEK